MAKADAVVTEKENVLIQTESCSVTVLPHLGGKISSLRFKGRELLQTPLAPLVPRSPSMSFDASDASGWDECLPSVAPCTVETPVGTARIPDHGDLWRVAWSVDGKREERSPSIGRPGAEVVMEGRCFSLPLTLERRITLTEHENRAHLRLDYTLRNTSRHSVPWSWSAHPLFAVEAGDQILLPSSVSAMRLEGSAHGRLGANGNTVNWPITMLADGSPGDLSIAQEEDSAIGDKLFAGPLRPEENWCILLRPKAGLRIKMSFDPQATPYLGLWICYGGWPNGPGPKQVCVAPEPSTAPVDSLARSGDWSRKLAPGASFAWPMFLDLGLI